MHAKLALATILSLFSISSTSAQQEINTSDIDTNLDNLEWALFSAGVLAGFAEAEAQNLGNDCLADAATIIFSSVHSYNYMMEYVEGNQTDNIALAYGLTYIIMGFDTYSTIDCSTL